MSDEASGTKSRGEGRDAAGRKTKAAGGDRRRAPRKRRRRRRAGRSASDGERDATVAAAGERPSQTITRALQLLEQGAIARIEELVPRRAAGRRAMRRLELELDLSFDASGRLADASTLRDEILRQIEVAAESFADEHQVLHQGVVPCLRHAENQSECACVRRPEPRQVLAGFSPSGMPRFVDFAQFLLDRSHPEIDRLYRGREAPLVQLISRDELEGDLLPAFIEGSPYVFHGQVSAGWYRQPNGERCAPTFLLVSVEGAHRPWQARLLELGTSTQSTDLEVIFGGAPPWREALSWARQAVADVERGAARERRKREAQRPKGRTVKAGSAAPEKRSSAADVGPKAAGETAWRVRAEQRLQGILEGLARRLERRERAVRRRTRHAEERRQEQRPTGMALPDLEAVPDERVLHDARRDTLIVLGDRGRVHVFNRDAKLVTSIRFTQPAIDRRLSRGTWKQAEPSVARDLRRRAPTAQRQSSTAGAAGAREGC